MRGMAAEALTAITSLGGVALGGSLSYAVQLATQRTAAQAERRKQELTLLESRRTERLALLEQFIGVHLRDPCGDRRGSPFTVGRIGEEAADEGPQRGGHPLGAAIGRQAFDRVAVQ
jgi:hypothetical protein